MPKICLNMIVKNEEKIIERMLESVYKIIDYFVICDTGSTDNTIEIIKNFFLKHRNIKGVIMKKKFENFEYNRNHALKFCEGFGDYILLLDADHILNYKESFLKKIKELNKDCYSIIQSTQNIDYQNIRLIKNHYKFYYKGYTHEVIMNDKVLEIEIFDESMVSINDIGDGFNKKNKLERDIMLLIKSIEDFPNDIRNYFYLANTYFSLQSYDLAQGYYLIRSKKGSWKQEIFYCYYRIGLIKIIKEEYSSAIEYFWEAYEVCPERSENLYYLYKLYKCLKKENLSKLTIKILKENKDKENFNFLFLDKNIIKEIQNLNF